MKGNKHWQTNGREKHRKYYRYIGSNILHSIDSSGILLGTWSPQQNLVFFSGHFGLRCTVYKIYKHEYIHTPIFHPKTTQDTSLHQDLFCKRLRSLYFGMFPWKGSWVSFNFGNDSSRRLLHIAWLSWRGCATSTRLQCQSILTEITEISKVSFEALCWNISRFCVHLFSWSLSLTRILQNELQPSAPPKAILCHKMNESKSHLEYELEYELPLVDSWTIT